MAYRRLQENKLVKPLEGMAGVKPLNSRGMDELIPGYPRLGATYLGDGRCQFVVWAPLANRVDVHLLFPNQWIVALKKGDRGYFSAVVEGVEPGSLYVYRLDEQKERPDPASRLQPQDVHGPSQVIESATSPEDDRWLGLPLREYIIYELHVGAFSTEGTFEAIIPHLDDLINLGVTALELMPIAQFPGSRNWGYDGVYPFAVQTSYGGPEGLRKLINACHQRGLAVVLDVVYNHLGPEGNYLWDFGPYFTDRYRTPWGPAINFDGPHSDEVQRFFIENALYWMTEFRVDAFRLDAADAIVDRSARPFLEMLAEAVHRSAEQTNRHVYVIAESDLNDARLIRPRSLGGCGLDAQWGDDFHHALHTLLTHESAGYYQDFGTVEQLAKAMHDGYIYTGQYSAYRQRRHGNAPESCTADQFVVCAQNHDQVGNRMLGERLSQLVPFEALKLAAGVVLLSPHVPLLFMGEEYGETAPFQYFVSHLDPQLVEAVRRGRREEFAAFAWMGEPTDPQDDATFLRAKLDHEICHKGHHQVLLGFYKELIELRKSVPALAALSKEQTEVFSYEEKRILGLRRWTGEGEVVTIFNLSDADIVATVPVPAGRWRKRLDSAEDRWKGYGSGIPERIVSPGESHLSLRPWSFVVFERALEG